jgi:GTP-binding protein
MALKIAIVGRPNVGKSTLFNRLAGKKLAIVDDQPGVTRDRKHAFGKLGDLDLELIDTAGFEDLTDDSLEARMRAQTEAAIAEADVILFLIDARVGVTPLDERFADIVRRSDKPLLLAANKAEGRAANSGVLDAYSLGLGEPIAISGEHGEGMGDLFAALAPIADSLDPPDADDADSAEARGEFDPDQDFTEAEEQEIAQRPIKLAIIGRPNAGKSTLINAILGEERLLTGPEAGITRDSISIDWSWRGRPVRLVDTAGMRRKAKVQERLEQLSVADTLRAIRFADVCCLIMDAREAFEKQDLAIADLVEREGRAIVYVLAKWDQVAEPGPHFQELKLVAGEKLPQLKGASLVTTAALTGQGLDRMMEAVAKAYRDWNARIKTSDLNAWMKHALERHPPPAVDGKRVKPRYIAQIKTRPPTFVLMSSRAADLPDSYKRYLVNGIREAFHMPGSPIRLYVRQKKNKYTDAP